MSEHEVAVVGMGLFLPEITSVEAFVEGRRDAEQALPKGAMIPPRDRRRTSVLTKALADAYAQALAASGAEPAGVASVFGSALGEASTMIGLLDQMWGEEGVLSPMRFVMSVHNAAAGVISLPARNRGFTTSLGADFDTPAMALLEGMGLVLARGDVVIVCCGDEAAPSDLVRESGGWALLAGALALGLVSDHPAAPRLSALTLEQGFDLEAPDVEPALTRNPNAGLLDLIDAIARDRRGRLRLDRGAGRGYGVTIRRS